jgi:hypothetical protein
MVWHLARMDFDGIKDLPPTHRLRRTSHEEFGALIEHLEVNQKDGMLKMRDPSETSILARLAQGDVDIRYDESAPDFILRGKSWEYLGLKDYALVFFQKVRGRYVHYDLVRAEEQEFRGMVDTGIIEPVNSQELVPIRTVVIARQVLSLNKRIKQVKRLIERPSERDNGLDKHNLSWDEKHLVELLKTFSDKREQLLKDPLTGKDRVEAVAKQYQQIHEITLAKRRMLELELQVEQGDEERQEQYRIEDNIELLDRRLDIFGEKLKALEVLLIASKT